MNKDEETGIVTPDPEVCIGCGSCAQACPYGMPVVDEDANLSTKCNFCKDRIADGLEPFCVEACPGRARIFGDIDDAKSEISAFIAERGATGWREEDGTKPHVYYC